MPAAAAHKTLVHLADGRELIYFDAGPGTDRAPYPDTRPLDPGPGAGESRFDPLLGEWVVVAAGRQVRPYHPGPDVCPLCPSTPARHTEIPAPGYEVAVAAFPAAYLDLLRRFQRLFGADAPPVPYIAAWYQAPSAEPRSVALHVEVFTVRRASGRLTYLAGTESGMGAFMRDIAPERAADLLRSLAP